MALDIPLPKKVYGHGWILMGGDKLSKSKGLVNKDVVYPMVLSKRYGSDAVRYVLLKEGPYAGDTPYTNETIISAVNSDLANSLGNLLSRTTAMIIQYFGGLVPTQKALEEVDKNLIKAAEELYGKYSKNMDDCNVPGAISEIFNIIFKANKYIDETAPWILFKEKNSERLGTVLYNLAETLRICVTALTPVLVKTSKQMLLKLGIDKPPESFEDIKKFGKIKAGTKVVKGENIFPRLDALKEIKELEEIATAESKIKSGVKMKENKPQISIDDFSKIEFKTALVLNCEKVEKSDKLLKLELEAGSEKRTVVSGIAKHYEPHDLVGKTVVLVANLEPAKLRGIESQGMILCAEDDEGNLSIITPEKLFKSGMEIR